MTDVIELELVEETPLDIDIDYDGEYVSGATGEEYQKGHADGQQAEYNAFWGVLLSNGNRTDCSYLFANPAWQQKTFRPAFDIRPKNASQMFRNFNNETTSEPIDFVELFSDLGVVFDISLVNNCEYMFHYAKISRLGTLNFTNCGYLSNTFNGCSFLETIEEIVFKDDGTQSLFAPFGNCTKLKNINSVKGKIGRDIDFKSSPLTPDSMKNIIGALKNYLRITNELKYTVSFSSGCWETLEASGAAPNGATWREYVEYTLGWNT